MLFWTVWGYCLVQRLGELWLAHRNWLGWQSKFERPAEPLFLAMVVLHTGFLGTLPVIFLAGPWPTNPLWLILFGLAQVLRYWLLVVMGRSWNTRIITGHNYPICDRGPYRYIRHPNYLVVIVEIFSFPMAFGMVYVAWIFSVLNGLVLLKRIGLEEKYLRQNPDWVQRMADKPRFIPGLRWL